MKRRPVHALLLLAALVLGQWLVLAHAADHALPGVDDAACVYCSQTSNPGPTPAAALGPCPQPAAGRLAPAVAVLAPAAPLAAAHRIRGPPRLSA